jgi:uncharacterized protein involved in exopolysaccharide biosynthesis
MAASDDEIDLKELFLALWKGKWLILLTTAIFAAGGVFYALSLPNIYKAEAVLAPAQEGGKSGLAGMAAQFGGLASLAGINIGGGSTDSKAMALATLQSRQFINAFIHKHELLVPLMAAKEWNAGSGELVIDPEVYNVDTQEWVREVEPGKSPQPSDWEAYKRFKADILAVGEAKDTGLVTLSVNHYSPEVAQQWVTWLVEDLNSWMKEKSLGETKRNIGYLEQQLQKTKVADMQSVFYQLIEEQTKNLMLAEVDNEFAFKTIDPAVVPEERAKPKRSLICVLATLLGGMLGVAVVLVRFAFRKYDTVGD